MPATITENYESREFTVSLEGDREILYDIIGTFDEAEVETLIASVAPAAYNGLAIESISANHLGGGVWKGSAKYRGAQSTDEYTFDTSGGTQKMTQSLETVRYPAPGRVAPDFGGAIGVTETSVEGVDIVVPRFEWTETHYHATGFVTAAYKLQLMKLTGLMNGSSWKGYAAGEVLFLGATGNQRGNEKWGITYRFSGSANTDSLMVSGIGPITKRGHDWLWIKYEDVEDASAYSLVKRPVAAYVERVYLIGDFSLLGIGV